jgi:hypothetical protein
MVTQKLHHRSIDATSLLPTLASHPNSAKVPTLTVTSSVLRLECPDPPHSQPQVSRMKPASLIFRELVSVWTGTADQEPLVGQRINLATKPNLSVDSLNSLRAKYPHSGTELRWSFSSSLQVCRGNSHQAHCSQLATGEDGFIEMPERRAATPSRYELHTVFIHCDRRRSARYTPVAQPAHFPVTEAVFRLDDCLELKRQSQPDWAETKSRVTYGRLETNINGRSKKRPSV